MLIPIERGAFLPFLLWSFAVGLLFGAVYDVFRVRRIAIRRVYGNTPSSKLAVFFVKNIKRIDFTLIFIEDIIFSVFCACTVILVDYKLWFGLPRWYSLASAGLGFLLYRNTLGRIVIRFAERIIDLICKLAVLTAEITVTPAVRLIGLIAEHRRKKQMLLWERRYAENAVRMFSRISGTKGEK